MKVSLYASALVGFIGLNCQGVQAVSLGTIDTAIDIEDYENTFSQIQNLLAIEGEGNTESDATGDETAGGVTLSLKGDKKCCEKACVPFEDQMLSALQELSGKSKDLYDALKLQFAKNQKMAAGKKMAVNGEVIIRPKLACNESVPMNGIKSCCNDVHV